MTALYRLQTPNGLYLTATNKLNTPEDAHILIKMFDKGVENALD